MEICIIIFPNYCHWNYYFESIKIFVKKMVKILFFELFTKIYNKLIKRWMFFVNGAPFIILHYFFPLRRLSDRLYRFLTISKIPTQLCLVKELIAQTKPVHILVIRKNCSHLLCTKTLEIVLDHGSNFELTTQRELLRSSHGYWKSRLLIWFSFELHLLFDDI